MPVDIVKSGYSQQELEFFNVLTRVTERLSPVKKSLYVTDFHIVGMEFAYTCVQIRLKLLLGLIDVVRITFRTSGLRPPMSADIFFDSRKFYESSIKILQEELEQYQKQFNGHFTIHEP